MKKLFFLIAAVVMAISMSVTAYAEHDTNLMKAYDKVAWEGDTVYYEDAYGTLSFKGDSGKAYVKFPTEGALGVWFYFVMGNLSGKGTGNCILEFLDENGEVIHFYETEKNNGNGSFNRYELGSEVGYAAVPENTENVRVTLCYDGGEQSPYFRNFSLILSNNNTVDSSINEWDVSGKLEIVQVGVTRTEHLIWIIFVALVALIMFGARKLTDKVKKVK